MTLHVYDPGAGTWASSGALPMGGTSCDGPTGRISTVYREHLTVDGDVVPGGNGALWTWYSTTCRDGANGSDVKRETFYRWTWGGLSADVRAFNLGKWHRTSLGNGDCGRVWRNSVGAGVAVVDHPDGLGALVAHDAAGTCPGGVWWVPHADGEVSTPAPVTDYDDAEHLAGSLCANLHVYDGGCQRCVPAGVQCAPAPFEPAACYDDEQAVSE